MALLIVDAQFQVWA